MSNDPLEAKDLPELVARVQALLINAEAALKTVSDERNGDYAAENMLTEYESKNSDIDFYLQVLKSWDGQESFSVYQQSEITFALSQIRRLDVVTKNLLRMLREELNIPDTERMQEEMQLQMMRMSALHK